MCKFKSFVNSLEMIIEARLSGVEKILIALNKLSCRNELATERVKRTPETRTEQNTYSLTSQRAIVIVCLYIDITCLKPSMSSPIYFSLAQS